VKKFAPINQKRIKIFTRHRLTFVIFSMLIAASVVQFHSKNNTKKAFREPVIEISNTHKAEGLISTKNHEHTQ